MASGGSLRLLSCAVLAAIAIAGFAQPIPSAARSATGVSPAPPKPAIRYGDLPLSFEPNLGQTDRQVQWLARGPQYTLFLAGHDAVLELNKITPAKRGAADPRK